MAEPFATPPKPEDLPPIEGEDDFDYLDGGDEAGTKLDLARAYIEMGDNDGARDILGQQIESNFDLARFGPGGAQRPVSGAVRTLARQRESRA